MTLRPHPQNPRYFAHEGGEPIFLTGSHTWANLASDQGTTRFDYDGYLDFLDAHGLNFFRGWVWDVPASDQGFNGGPFAFTPYPWRRTGPGLATDGQPRFDLTAWNEEFFGRVRSRVIEAGGRGMYVAVMFFQGFAWQHNRRPDDGFPYDGRNNVNGVDSGPADAAATLDHPEVTREQEAYVTKLVETLGDLDNVLWEISNESGPESTAWQYHFIDFVHELERSRGSQHPVGMTFQFEHGSNQTLYDSPADWISPDCDPADRAEPPVADGSKVIVFDTDHGYDWRTLRSDGPAGWRAWAWKCTLRGNNTLFMDPYLATIVIDGEVRNAPTGVDPDDEYFGLTPDVFWNPLRAVLGVTRAVLDSVDLVVTLPHPELASSGYCLADPGRDYLVYSPVAGDLRVDVPAGQYTASWLDPTTGLPIAVERIVASTDGVTARTVGPDDALLRLEIVG